MNSIDIWCTPAEVNRERAGYVAAFTRGNYNVRVSTDATPLLEPDRVLLYPDPPETLLPAALPWRGARSLCFQIDSYVAPAWRALWSSLFDHVAVFHPGDEAYYARFPHPGVFLLPHAVDPGRFKTADGMRDFEVGWVGSITGKIYSARRRVLPAIASRFRMNAWEAVVPEAEVPLVYARSRVVVNVSRDDRPMDANLRCFEAMAAGALLITALPSELESIGLRAGLHFIGYRHEAEIPQIVAAYLSDEPARRRLAATGRAAVLSAHTYDERVRQLRAVLSGNAVRMAAPARQWTQARRDYVYLHYHCKRVQLSVAARYFRRISAASPILAARALPLLLRCAIWHRRRMASATLPPHTS